MKKIILSSAIVLALFSCGNNNTPKQETKPTDSTEVKGDSTAQAQYFGDKITEDGAIALADLKTAMGDKKELNTKVTGEVEAVCQKKGCWMNIKNAAGESMRVTFKNYEFFMPMDCAGKTAIVEGVAKIEETSIADLKEYAKDDNQSKEAIAAIKEPKKELVFEANGVILR
ncbi:MAG: DUF4920 domain-containing protein [Bacteroidota bacterium]